MYKLQTITVMKGYMSELDKTRSMMRFGFFVIILCVTFLILCIGISIIAYSGRSEFNWLGLSEFILSVAFLYAVGATGKYFQKKVESPTQN